MCTCMYVELCTSGPLSSSVVPACLEVLITSDMIVDSQIEFKAASSAKFLVQFEI